MSAQVFERPQAKIDFWSIVDHLASQSVSLAERFIKGVEDSHTFLADFPISGQLIEDDEINLKNVRVCCVEGFRNYLIVFRADVHRVEILRYTYASRDLIALLQDS